jgi:hypothetical protein
MNDSFVASSDPTLVSIVDVYRKMSAQKQSELLTVARALLEHGRWAATMPTDFMTVRGDLD